MRLLGDRDEIVLVDQMSVAATLRAEPPCANPPPDGLRVSARPMRRLRHGKHASEVYYYITM
jgi:hypothetical protein